MTTFIGIDPGFKGAIAIIHKDGVKVIDSPTLTVGTKRDYHIHEMIQILDPYTTQEGFGINIQAAIEKVHAIPPPASRASAFTFGKGFGIWLGILAALWIPCEQVTPQRWQKEMMDGMQKGKDASRAQAMALFPAIAEELKRKADDGRADALLIAEWRRRQG